MAERHETSNSPRNRVNLVRRNREVVMERLMLRCRVVTGHHRQRGLTLIELMAVITIIGILAVIAMVGYRKYMLNAKVAEGRAGISAIRIAQEDYRTEKGAYANVGTGYCPSHANAGKEDV